MSGTRRWSPPLLQLAQSEEAPAVFTLRVKLLEASRRTLTDRPLRGRGAPAPGSPGGTNTGPHSPTAGTHGARVFWGQGRPRRDFTSSLPGPTQSLQASPPAPQKLLVPDLGAGTCSPVYPSLSVCAWKRAMGRSGPKPRSNLWFRIPVRVINLSSWNLCISARLPASATPLAPAPSSVDAQLPRLHAHPSLWVL